MKRFLVIRRDNIGDLVCTTPMLHSLRKKHPDAWIGVLANSYNVAVLRGNPDVSEVFSYRKAKHREPGESRLLIWLETARLIWKLRRKKVDVAIVASPGGERYARMIGARRIISHKPGGKMHEVERCVAMLGDLGEDGLPGPVHIVADKQSAGRLAAQRGIPDTTGIRVAVHISARRPKQRWPVAGFADLIKRLLDSGDASQVLLFWSPGKSDDPAHPGDDEKLDQLMGELPGLPVFPIRTSNLDELIAGLSLCQAMICSDGGAMHVAAALGKPIVCLFGDSDVDKWHPWGVSYKALRPESRNVADVQPESIASAFRQLMRDTLGLASECSKIKILATT